MYTKVNRMVTNMNDIDVRIGAWVADKRQKKGITQGELGKALGVTKQTICHYELGDRAMTANTFLKICKILDADPAELTVIR